LTSRAFHFPNPHRMSEESANKVRTCPTPFHDTAAGLVMSPWPVLPA